MPPLVVTNIKVTTERPQEAKWASKEPATELIVFPRPRPEVASEIFGEESKCDTQ